MAEQQSNRAHRAPKEKKQHSGGPNPKAFAYAAPGRLQKQAARSHDVRLQDRTRRSCQRDVCADTKIGQRKAVPRAAGGSSTGRSTTYYCRRRRTARSRKDHSDQVSGPSLHKTDPFASDRTPHSGHIEKTTTHLHRDACRLSG